MWNCPCVIFKLYFSSSCETRGGFTLVSWSCSLCSLKNYNKHCTFTAKRTSSLTTNPFLYAARIHRHSLPPALSLSLNHTLATHTTRSGATFVTGYQRVFLIHLHFINWPQRGFVGLVCPFWSTAETCWCNMVDSGRGPALCVYINSHLLILR